MKRFTKGIVLKGETTDVTENAEGSLFQNSAELRLKAYIEGAVRQIVTNTQSQVLTNKTIDADNNSVSNIQTTNLKSGVLNTSTTLSGASNTQLPSALAVKTYIDDKTAAQNEASEISFAPAGTISATNVQAMGQELDGDIQGHITSISGAHAASAISNTPSGNLAATTVQAALNELQGDVDTRATSTDLTNHTTASANVHGIGVSNSVVGTGTSQALTNKTIDASLNTISNISNTNIAAGAAIERSKLASGSANRVVVNDASGVASDAAAITAARALISDANGIPTHSTVTSTTLAFLDATSSVQTQLNSKVNASGGTLTNGSIVTPARLDVKQDTLSNLTTYAASATNGQIVFATDEKKMYQVVDGQLVSIGGAGIVKLTAGENISINDLVYISTGTGNDSARTAGRVYKVDASNDDRVEVLGFATKAITSGAIGEIQTSGSLPGFSGLTPGRIYYASASTPGAITLTPPSTNGQWVVAVGLATSATELVINPVSSASAIYVVDGDTSFTIANNQSSAANVTGLLIDGASTRSFILDYSIYRQTATALSGVAQVGQLRGVYNTQSASWFMSDDFSGQNAGVTFSILSSGQIQYTSTNIAGTSYVGTLKYAIRKTFGV
jgi:hypothetical protein